MFVLPTLASRSPTVRDVLARLREQIERQLDGNGPVSLVLFGSHARGHATEDSDVDVLVVLPTDCASTRAFVMDAAAAVYGETGLLLNPVVFSAPEHARRLAGGHPLLTKIAAEGIVA